MRGLRGRSGEVTVSIGISFGIVIGVVAIGFTSGFYRVARNVPMIHDITTDPGNPPAFVTLAPERNASWNGAAYGGAEVAAKQRAAYPDIAPIASALPPGKAFERALDVARGLGWKIADASPADGRIEATDTTRLLRFRDDVVVRVAPAAGETSRLDLRSASRVGVSDLGKNAERIREFARRYGGMPPAPGASGGAARGEVARVRSGDVVGSP
jgi:uncharacterized protein (DUF1499 family)